MRPYLCHTLQAIHSFYGTRAQIDDQNSHQTFIRILMVYYLVAPSENVNYITYAIKSFMKV